MHQLKFACKPCYPLVFLLLLLGLLACEEDEATTTEPETPQAQALKDTALIIGTYQGFCYPPDSCVAVYKVSANQVYADTTHHYPYDSAGYQFMALAASQYQKVDHLKAAFPRQLLTDTTTELGCPDCRDQGGYYIALKAADYQKRWVIDKDRDAVSPYLHPFLRKVDSAVNQLP
jgi:hypothetical protein